ncbi:hypothetical protein [Streptomyces lutosisoli]|uniref:Uncharacterized protein n=1 Tax=Streptomyces lutosisoli TaxID=2665721 RepID=A0ABW2VWK5_9ACTN
MRWAAVEAAARRALLHIVHATTSTPGAGTGPTMRPSWCSTPARTSWTKRSRRPPIRCPGHGPRPRSAGTPTDRHGPPPT